MQASSKASSPFTVPRGPVNQKVSLRKYQKAPILVDENGEVQPSWINSLRSALDMEPIELREQTVEAATMSRDDTNETITPRNFRHHDRPHSSSTSSSAPSTGYYYTLVEKNETVRHTVRWPGLRPEPSAAACFSRRRRVNSQAPSITVTPPMEASESNTGDSHDDDTEPSPVQSKPVKKTGPLVTNFNWEEDYELLGQKPPVSQNKSASLLSQIGWRVGVGMHSWETPSISGFEKARDLTNADRPTSIISFGSFRSNTSSQTSSTSSSQSYDWEDEGDRRSSLLSLRSLRSTIASHPTSSNEDLTRSNRFVSVSRASNNSVASSTDRERPPRVRKDMKYHWTAAKFGFKVKAYRAQKGLRKVVIEQRKQR